MAKANAAIMDLMKSEEEEGSEEEHPEFDSLTSVFDDDEEDP